MHYVCTNRHSMVTVRESVELLPPDACDTAAFLTSSSALSYGADQAEKNGWELDADWYAPSLVRLAVAEAKKRCICHSTGRVHDVDCPAKDVE